MISKKIIYRFILAAIALGGIFAMYGFVVDAKNSAVSFTIKNFGIDVNGSIKIMGGQVEFNEKQPEKSIFKITLDAKSINTSNKIRDEHLMQSEFFDAVKFPVISFISKQISKTSSGYLLNGTLTIRAKSQPVSIAFTNTKGTSKVNNLSGTFTINRLDFGVGEKSISMADSVKIKISVTEK